MPESSRVLMARRSAVIGQGASATTQYDSRPDEHHARAVRLSLSRRLLPVRTKLGQEAGAGFALLCEFLLATISVIPNGAA